MYRWVGVRGALLVHCRVRAIGYGRRAMRLIGGFVPIFTLIRLVKIAENSIDYSLMNTTRHALFLPVDRDAKYEGKTAIDTFFWRFGDLIQAGVVYLGLHGLGWSATEFALLNLVLALVWIGARGLDRPRVPRKAQRERHQRGAAGGAANPGPARPARAGRSGTWCREDASATPIPATCCT